MSKQKNKKPPKGSLVYIASYLRSLAADTTLGLSDSERDAFASVGRYLTKKAKKAN